MGEGPSATFAVVTEELAAAGIPLMLLALSPAVCASILAEVPDRRPGPGAAREGRGLLRRPGSGRGRGTLTRGTRSARDSAG